MSPRISKRLQEWGFGQRECGQYELSRPMWFGRRNRIQWLLVPASVWLESIARVTGKESGISQIQEDRHMSWSQLSASNRSYQAAETRQLTLSGYLLHESNLHRQTYRLSANTLQLCTCGQSIDDLEHFFLECNQYDKARRELRSAITDVWNDSENSKKCRISVPLLLAPAVNSNLSTSDCQTILSCTFKFIQQSGRIL